MGIIENEEKSIVLVHEIDMREMLSENLGVNLNQVTWSLFSDSSWEMLSFCNCILALSVNINDTPMYFRIRLDDSQLRSLLGTGPCHDVPSME